MMRSNNSDSDNENILQNTLEVDNEKLPTSKLVEKQMFAESKQIQDNQSGNKFHYFSDSKIFLHFFSLILNIYYSRK